MKSAKHQPSYEGPFTVVRRKESGNYELKGVGGAIYTRAPWVLNRRERYGRTCFGNVRDM
jgi:hypothetical protein